MNIMTQIPTPADLLRGTSQWLKEHPKSRYCLAFLIICSICYIINQGVAWADTEQEPTAQMLFLPLGGITDTYGVPAWRYLDLPMDPGNAGYVFRGVRHAIASILWLPYAAIILLLISLVDWLVSFEWLTWIAAPFETISTGLNDVLEAWMLIPLGITISALWIGIGFLRGRMGAATVEFFMVALVVGVIASPLAQPFDILAGDGNSSDSSQGLIAKAGDIGAEAGALTINQDAAADDLSLSASIIDVTLRRPLLTMSFGSPLEGECAESWNTNAAADSGNDAEDIRKEVIKCDDAVADANQTSSYMWLGTYVFAWFATIGIMLLMAVFTVFLIWQVIQAFIAAIVTGARAFIAMFPGNSRTAWLESLFQVVVSGALVGVYIFALTIYMHLIGVIVDSMPPSFLQVGAIIMGLIIVVVAITFWKMKRSGESIGKRIARALTKNGLNKNTQERQPTKLGSVIARGAEFYQRSKMLKAGTKAATAVATGGTGAAAASIGKTMAAKTGQKMMQQSLPPAQPSNALPAASTQQQLAPVPQVQKELPPAEPPEEAHPPPPTPLPSGPDGAPQGTLPSRKETGQVTESAANSPAPHDSTSPPAPVSKHETSHIPAGRYGNTYVHKGGQISAPMTINEHGKQVKNVPSDDKIQRAYKDNGAWVTTDADQHAPTPTAMRSRYNQRTEG
jgi:hypothetical protein